jgi:pilus assembly protein CpaF
MVLKKQQISENRKDQLVRAFLLLSPDKRFDADYYEIYLLDGTRVTVFLEPMAKKGQSSIVFRRYLIPKYSFEEQAKRNTVPVSAVPLLTSMAKIGYNVVFTGAVRTAKTSFLSTWQSYEDETLEGVLIETDPEIPMHEILPDAPIIQLIADGDRLRQLSKNLLRSDADYFIMAEARDGIALDTAVKLATKGTKRMKLTFHSRDPGSVALEMATEIVKSTGGDLPLTMQMVASAFDYLFHFIQLPDKSQKRLKGIYQIDCSADGTFRTEQICRYDPASESWTFRNCIGERQRSFGEESDGYHFRRFEEELERLSEKEYVR